MIGANDEFFANNDQFKLAVLQQATNNFLNRVKSLSDVDSVRYKVWYAKCRVTSQSTISNWEGQQNGTTE